MKIVFKVLLSFILCLILYFGLFDVARRRNWFHLVSSEREFYDVLLQRHPEAAQYIAQNQFRQLRQYRTSETSEERRERLEMEAAYRGARNRLGLATLAGGVLFYWGISRVGRAVTGTP
ncbi:MAG: hypothetical protein HY652_15260 [Acidobacteria bacterium]|nr:hypothetical protein [Acidobacteriota bacterium]